MTGFVGFLVGVRAFLAEGSYFLFQKSGYRFINFVYFFKKTALRFIDLFYWFFYSILFISALIFIVSLLLLGLGCLCSSASISFRCAVRFCIWDFSCFLR